jgi:hypothetical protein
LLKFAEDIRAGIVEDCDDEILGIILKELYPQLIPPDRIFDYLHVPKVESLIGSYRVFWIHYLPEKSSKESLLAVLDRFIQVKPDIDHILKEHHQNRMAGNLLVRGLKEFGDTIANEQLYDWLGIGLNEHDGPRLDRESAEFIAAWFADRPERYKAMIELGAARCANHENTRACMYRCENHLYRSRPPNGIEMWYLEKAATEQHHGLAEFYFDQAIRQLKQRGEQQELTLSMLASLEKWIVAYPNFQSQFEQVISCPIGDGQHKFVLEDRQRGIEQEAKKKGWVNFLRSHVASIRDGSAYPKILHDLAQAYKKLISGMKGGTPRECLNDFLNGDEELIEAAYSGFRHALDRHDLPSVSEIVDLETKGQMHVIRSVCLVGMEELFQNDPINALRLEDAVLSRLIAFQLTYGNYNDSEWFKVLVKQRPALVAEVLLVYLLAMLRAGKENVSGLSSLVCDDAYSEVARAVLPKLLEEFSLRARKIQLPNTLVPLLKGALRYLDREVFTTLVARKLELKSMNAAQRVYWLGCGLLIAPDIYETRLFQHIGANAVRKGCLVNFLYHDQVERHLPDWVLFSETMLSRLIGLLAQDCSPEYPMGVHRVSPSMHTADMVRSFINKLSN